MKTPLCSREVRQSSYISASSILFLLGIWATPSAQDMAVITPWLNLAHGCRAREYCCYGSCYEGKTDKFYLYMGWGFQSDGRGSGARYRLNILIIPALRGKVFKSGSHCRVIPAEPPIILKAFKYGFRSNENQRVTNLPAPRKCWHKIRISEVENSAALYFARENNVGLCFAPRRTQLFWWRVTCSREGTQTPQRSQLVV